MCNGAAGALGMWFALLHSLITYRTLKAMLYMQLSRQVGTAVSFTCSPQLYSQILSQTVKMLTHPWHFAFLAGETQQGL